MRPTVGFSLRVFRLAFVLLVGQLVFPLPPARGQEAAVPGADAEAPVSFYDQIRPIFQANCHGCHQPALDNGGYVMTDFSRLLLGGESELDAVVAHVPAESYLLDLVTPVDGYAEMPKGKQPLLAGEIELIRRWISAGAVDDTPPGAQRHFDSDHPPTYSRPPVIPSIDFSPQGKLLAVAGFHEVLLVDTERSELAARLIGVSQRIESVRFSPDGSRLLVTGGLPGRMGEVQVWDVAAENLILSVPVTYDTVYGGSWSPDGKLIAFGCGDNTVRAIDAQTGEQVLFQGAHNDWVLDTVFSRDGSHLVSVGRDMTCKLTEVPTERFVDNITSITPGVLKGGVNAVARHPERDEIVVGGSDGVAKVYRMFRQTVRRIGDDANLIREMPSMRGRVFGIAVSPDGRRIAAVSSLDNRGLLHVYSYEFDTALPDAIKKIQEKTVDQRSPQESRQLDSYHRQDVQLIASAEFEGTGLYSVAFAPDCRQVAVAGSDGAVRLVDAASGQQIDEFWPAPISGASETAPQFPPVEALSVVERTAAVPQTVDGELADVSVQPAAVLLGSQFDYAQLVVTGELDSGERFDMTRLARFSFSDDHFATVSETGVITPQAEGQATLLVEVAGRTITVPVSVTGFVEPFTADFARDVAPILSRLGCNAGTCHGAAQGKNGFKLSLRGYDPLFDVRALTDDLAARRTNGASPDDSLMLLKATGAVPHVGSQLVRPGEPYYRLIRSWISAGAELNTGTPGIVSIEVQPHNPVIQRVGGGQQVRVVATYADGQQRDVTREAFIESGNTEIAAASRTGLMTAVRRGEAPILARYEGAYDSTTLTVMGDREEFVWRQPETWGRIDELVAAKWRRMKIEPSGLCDDAEYLRRVHLDLTGLPPTAVELRRFLGDPREPRVKRAEVVEQLVGNSDYVEYWTNKWADLLQVNSKFLGRPGAEAFRKWIRQEVAANTPYDAFARKILTAGGSNKENPAASYFKILREPAEIMENTTHLFLAVRFNCNKCHDHPFERWTQDQYYETAAFFARTGLKADPTGGDRKIAGTAVESATPLYEVVFERDSGEVQHERTGEVTAPVFPFAATFAESQDMTRRQRLAAWITSADNPYFARSYVNRLWGYLLGVGIIEPIDDIRASNVPSNPELLDYLTQEFVRSGFDVQYIVRLICQSRTYQLSVATNAWNADDTLNYSHATARRLPAEVLFDAIHRVTGATPKIPGVPEGTRAAELPDAEIKLPDGFLTNLGRPPRESACECERTSGLQLGPVMALISGPTVASAIDDEENAIARLVADETNDARLVNELFLRILNRPATAVEVAAVLDNRDMIQRDHARLVQALAEREAWWKERKPELERERQEAIQQATQDLDSYTAEIAPRIQAAEAERAAEAKRRRAELDEFLAELDTHLAAWENVHGSSTEWHLLEAHDLSATGDIQLQRLADRSIQASGHASKSRYTIEVRTRLGGITGVRLEALTLAGSEGSGPGLPANGNFVVTEFELQAASAEKPDEFSKVELRDAKADFTQNGDQFSIDYAIDGNPRDQRGWAIAPAGGIVHWATFETVQPVGFDEGTVLRFVVHQNHNAEKHLLGRFRLAVTGDPAPLGLSLPESLKAAISIDPSRRDKPQQELLSEYYQATDPEVLKQKQALAAAERPLPEDPGVTRRKETLERARSEIADDPRLVQLRQDVQYSQRQVENERLTAAQDLAWALINSPAFLFNR